MNKLFSLRKLLWIDGTAALLAGTILLIFNSRLATLFNLPENLIVAQGVTNFIYCSYSLSLARHTVNSKRSVSILAVANASYALLALCLLVYFFQTASIYGILYLLAEVLFIGLLAVLEWRKIK